MKIFCDVETTGLNANRNDIVSYSLITEQGEMLNGKIRPMSVKNWDEGAASVHGFSLKEAMNFHEPEEAVDKIWNFLKVFDKCDFICHALLKNGGYFDYKFMRMLFFWQNKEKEYFYKRFHPSRVYSTIDLAKTKNLQVKNYKLNTLCGYFDIELKHHDALSDTLACKQLWEKLNEI